jgi:hypothetical protein
MESENQNQQASNSERKQELELKKLNLEISELEKPWFKKPNFIVPLIGAMSSIFILWVTGFFNTKIESLSNKREILNFENAKLEERKNSLVNDIKNLRDSLKIATKPNLSIQVVSVSSEKEIGIQIQNNGTGIAYFKHINMHYKGEDFICIDLEKDNYFAKVIKAMNIYDSFMTRYEGKTLSDSYEKAGSLGPGQSYFPLRLSKSDYTDENANIFLRAIEGLEIEIEYYSINGKNYIVKKKLELYEITK